MKRSIATACALASFAATATPAVAAADACRDPHGHLRAPIAIGSEGADFGGAASACAGQRLALDLRADAAIAAEAPNFYGDLRAAALLSGSWAPSDRVWFDGAIDAGRYDFVANASMVGKGLGAGPATVTGHFVLERGARFQIAPFARVLLPIETGFSNAWRAAVEPGIAATFALSPRWALLASGSYPLQTTWLGARVHWRFTPRVAADLAWSVGRRLELLAGGELRLIADRDGALDSIGARGAARLHLGRGVDLHLEAVVPIAGLDKTDLRLAIGGAVRW